MSIPPFSEHDLAVLVLGYLHDEDLMTVYDEFLMASPHLDAQKNEYKRIFMKSLQSIVSEYWAIKIYLEKCKPYPLRRKLKQCPNMLEAIKFLIFNVDMKKIEQLTNISNKPGERSRILSVPPRDNNREKECHDCSTSKFDYCLSNKRENEYQSIVPPPNQQPMGLALATSLADLPGNGNTTKRKQMKVLERDRNETVTLHRLEEWNVRQNTQLSYDQLPVEQSNHSDKNLPPQCGQQSMRSFSQEIDPVSNSNGPDNRDHANDDNMSNRSETFHDFASGVESGNHISITKPDSSTTEPVNNLASTSQAEGIEKVLPKIIHPTLYPCNKIRTYMIQVTNTKNEAVVPQANTENASNNSSDDNKITIISDVKVDNGSSVTSQTKRLRRVRVPPAALRNATSSPMLQMQKIVINGTPAYKPDHQAKLFTKEEIMAMPTLIIVTASEATKNMPGNMQISIPKPNVSVTGSTLATTCTTSVVPTMEPLRIDVHSSPTTSKTANHSLSMPPISASASESGLITTVDNMRNASVPKDSIISTIGKTSTPQVLPPARKSSSTPRRTSHVRVLDFTTPRRILHESINENPVEVIISRSPNLHDTVEEQAQVDNTQEISSACNVGNQPPVQIDDSSTKENKMNAKKNWDADLRALIGSNAPTNSKSIRKPRPKKKNPVESSSDHDKKAKKKKKGLPKKAKRSKKKGTEEQNIEKPTGDGVLKPHVNEPIEVPANVKPTIHIVTDWNDAAPEAEKPGTKSCGDTSADTPEMDKLSLQNAIGAKLNISDLLETPYKQALYDIQMETPKFLRPDILISDEPISEIKITDIPTPRFFEMAGLGFTPKAVESTTSSYPSRPTDYSSGGSYYKPDDHDYEPHPNDLGCPITSSEPPKPEQSKVNEKEEKKINANKSSRPVRQCTKNISYFDNTNKTNHKLNDTQQLPSRDTTVSSSFDSDVESIDNINVSAKQEKKTQSKVESKRKSTSSQKRKSTHKKATPMSFMKIKPRRPTPTKESRRKSSSSHTSQSKTQSRKRTNSKENSATTTPPLTPAPTKSRRKSSTPRKIPAKVNNSSESPNINTDEGSVKNQEPTKQISPPVQDSDNENLPLHWSDDCSQETKPNPIPISPANDAEDISQIQQYIEQSYMKDDASTTGKHIDTGSLHMDLIKRGFDFETAKSIERDLLDTTPLSTSGLPNVLSAVQDVETNNKSTDTENRTATEDSDKTADSQKLHTIQEVDEDNDDDEMELSAYECNDDHGHYVVCEHDDSIDLTKTEPHKLKENFTMEFCIDDDTFRLKTTNFTVLFTEEPKIVDEKQIEETEAAVSSISNIDRLYSPMKKSTEATCREIFESTLASIDTPMKADSPKRDATVTEIVLEVEPVKDEVKEKASKKRKRMQSGSASDDSMSDNKRNRKEPRLLPNIQNIDIESVLSKLHGP